MSKFAPRGKEILLRRVSKSGIRVDSFRYNSVELSNHVGEIVWLWRLADYAIVVGPFGDELWPVDQITARKKEVRL